MHIVNKLPLILLLLVLGTSGCTLLYVPDVQQGNVISDDMLAKLKPGMTTNQVRFVLGSPLILDPFHKERWDYFYSYRDYDKDTFEKNTVTVLFDNGKMTEVIVNPKRPVTALPEPADKEKIIISPEIHEKIGPNPD